MKNYTLRKQLSLMVFLFTVGTFLLYCNPANCQDFTFEYAETTRNYRLHLPDTYAADSVPLIMAIHGYARNPEKMEFHSHLSEKANDEGFIVVYPEGTQDPLLWNTEDAGTDDKGFLLALLDTLIENYPVDTSRIYLTGFSNGAEMTYKLAQEVSVRFAGIAPVANYWWNDEVTPEKPMPIITFHAINDGGVPISGVQPVLDHWIEVNNCQTEPDTFYLVDGAIGVRWKNIEDNGNDIVFFKTDVGQHSWPGGEYSWATPSQAINATDLMWSFFTKELPEVWDPPVQPDFLDNATKDVSLQIHPNPVSANSSFIIDAATLNGQAVKILLHTLSGKTILDSRIIFQGNSAHVNLSDLSLMPGLYALTLQSDQQIFTRSLIVR